MKTLNESIDEIFNSKLVEYEYASELSILPCLVKMKPNGFKWIVWGGGKNEKFLLTYYERVHGIRPDYIVDSKLSSIDLIGIASITGEDFTKLSMKECYLLITQEDYKISNSDTRENINSKVYEFKKYTPNVIISMFPFCRYRIEWRDYFVQHIDEIKNTASMLKDQISVDTLCCFLRSNIRSEVYSGLTYSESLKYWGNDDKGKQLFSYLDRETLLNIGAASGDTVYYFLSNFPSFKKIIAVEADAEICEKRLRRNLSFLDDDIRERIIIDQCLLGDSINKVDDRYLDEEITLINMDVEGFELRILKSGLGVIKRNRPVLSVCVYHKASDLVEIPKWISENLVDYYLFLRMYKGPLGGSFLDQQLHISEMVLYAIPGERLHS